MSQTILEYNTNFGTTVSWGSVVYAQIGTGHSYESSTATLGSSPSFPTVPNPSALISVTIGNIVTSFGGPSAFNGCSLLHTVTFTPTSILETISDAAFINCIALQSIIIPDSVTSIGDSAFSGCSILNPVTISQTSSLLHTIGTYTFYNCAALTSIIIPNSVQTIGANAFDSCILLNPVTISQTSSLLQTIGEAAFFNCQALQSIAIPNSVTSIGVQAFQSCYALATVTISQSSSSLQTIGTYTFAYCPFTSITIPDSFQINGATIGTSAFQNSGLDSNGPSGVVTIDQLTITSLGIQGDIDISNSTALTFYGATNVLLSITCYEANTLILILENNEEVYKKVSKLKVGDLVKTYKKGYKKIKLLHSFKYKPPSGIKGLNMLYKHKENGVILTGGHSILVDELTEQEKINNLKQCGFNKTIEDKKLLLACSSDKFEKIDNGREYYLYHFSLETDDPKEHFGVYITDGILSESCPKDALLRMVSKRAIIKNVVRKMH